MILINFCNHDIEEKEGKHNHMNMDRNALRKTLLERIRNFPFKKEESRMIIKSIAESDEWKTAETVLAFCPLQTEPDISPLLEDDRVLLPYIENGEMKFSSSRNLTRSRLGFLEPEHTEAEYEKAFMLVPLLGFNGLYRLGRGGGFYDRYIRKRKYSLYTAGVAFSVSYCPEFVPEERDEELQMIFSTEV